MFYCFFSLSEIVELVREADFWVARGIIAALVASSSARSLIEMYSVEWMTLSQDLACIISRRGTGA